MHVFDGAPVRHHISDGIFQGLSKRLRGYGARRRTMAKETNVRLGKIEFDNFVLGKFDAKFVFCFIQK